MKGRVKEQRASNGKLLPTPKQRVFAEAYIKNKRNGTKAALEAYETKDPKVAGIIAVENLSKPSVKQAIAELLEARGLDFDTVIHTHKRNIIQEKNLLVSQNAIVDYYELVGLKKKEEAKNGSNIAFIINK
jgi:hypothetical protein